MWRATLCRAAIVALAAALSPGAVAFAHTGPPPQPEQIWQSWSWQPGVLLGLLLTGGLYLGGLRRIWRRAGSGHGIRLWQAQSFMAGLAVIFVALLSPLDALSSALFSAHMVQHLLLILVAAPLIVLGAPLAPSLWALPFGWRRTLGHWRSRPWVRGPWLLLRRPWVAWLLAVVALWLWHLPALYQAALRSNLVHSLEHACLLGTALLFWYMLAARSGKHGFARGEAIAYTFAMGFQCAILGIAMTFSPSPWYSAYAATTGAWRLSPLEDQQLAGLIMWIPAGAVYLAAGLALFARMLIDNTREPGHALVSQTLGELQQGIDGIEA